MSELIRRGVVPEGHKGRVAEVPYGESVSFVLASGERFEVDTGYFPTRDVVAPDMRCEGRARGAWQQT
ncbi:hypothetical protein [Streptomyces sp. NPDC057336]|uniref:hypothetical protein n=1 Tax=Streptomyces sp. NPDC057336 TaxID=3346102 RepID=UPI00363A7ADC